MSENKAERRWYTADDVELAKAALEELPDLSRTRLSKSSVLEELSPQIVMLADAKGYSTEDIKTALETVGIVVGIKAIRDILNSRKKPARAARPARKNDGQKHAPAGKIDSTPPVTEAPSVPTTGA